MILDLLKRLFGWPGAGHPAPNHRKRHKRRWKPTGATRSASGSNTGRTRRPMSPKTSRQPQPTRHGGWKRRVQGVFNKQFQVVFHGTPSPSNAADILKNGFLAGAGNALGSGVYFSTNINEAKGYARGTGVYLKCTIRPKRVCTWDTHIDQRFRAWCTQRKVHPDANARTAFLLHEGYDTLQAGTVLVALRPLFANPTAHKVKLRQVRVIGVFRADNDQRIRV